MCSFRLLLVLYATSPSFLFSPYLSNFAPKFPTARARLCSSVTLAQLAADKTTRYIPLHVPVPGLPRRLVICWLAHQLLALGRCGGRGVCYRWCRCRLVYVPNSSVHLPCKQSPWRQIAQVPAQMMALNWLVGS